MGFLSDFIDNPFSALTGTTAARRELDRGYSGAAGLLEPYTSQGPGLLERLLSGDVGAGQDPGYKFRLNEGANAVQDRFAASGSPFSGPSARALTQFGQGTAAQEYGSAYDRLARLLEMSYGATQTVAGNRVRQGQAEASLATRPYDEIMQAIRGAATFAALGGAGGAVGGAAAGAGAGGYSTVGPYSGGYKFPDFGLNAGRPLYG